MTLDEYQTQRADLEAQLVALQAEWASSQEYPKWVYHETQPAQIVESPAQLEALGAGWTTVPGASAPETPEPPEVPPATEPEAPAAP
jgi:hypothetical protein